MDTAWRGDRASRGGETGGSARSSSCRVGARGLHLVPARGRAWQPPYHRRRPGAYGGGPLKLARGLRQCAERVPRWLSCMIAGSRRGPNSARWSEWLPSAVLVLLLLAVGLGIYRKTSQAVAPPMYD